MFDNYLASQFKHDDNAYDIKGIIVDEPVKANEIIMQFPIDVLILSDTDVYNNLKSVLGNYINDTHLRQFSLAIKILYNPKKYSNVHRYILNNYKPNKPFLFNQSTLSKIKDTLVYHLSKECQYIFDTMVRAYRNFEEDLTTNTEFRLRVIYSFCNSHSHGININNVIYRCINPFYICNHKPTADGKPILIHEVKNNVWTVRTNRDYEANEEILDCYSSSIVVSHFNYNKLKFKDWKLPMGMFYGIMTDIVPNNDNTLGFQLNLDDYDEIKIARIQNTYDKFDLNMLDSYIKENEDSQLAVAYQLVKIEINYFNQFKVALANALLKKIEEHYANDDGKHPDIHEEFNRTVDMVIE